MGEGETVLRYNYRALPNDPQKAAISRTIGSCRVVFNDYLRANYDAWAARGRSPSRNELSKQLITQAKKTPERAWLAEVSAVALQQALADAHNAFSNFYRSCGGTRNGRRVGRPKFRSRHDSQQSIRFTANARFKVERVGRQRGVLTLPGIGRVPFVWSRDLPSTPSSVTLTRRSTGEYDISFVIRLFESPLSPTGANCAIDLGLSAFATVLSGSSGVGERIERLSAPQYLRRKERALARSQRSLSRKRKGSANRAKAKIRVAKLRRHVANARLDHAHQAARRIVDAHDVVVVEDLNVSGMARGHLAKSVHDAGLGQFRRILSEKCERGGRTLITVDRFFPSTQICSSCQHSTGPKGLAELSVRIWMCSACGASHDRDANAARNLLGEGMRLAAQSDSVAGGHPETQNACGLDVSHLLADAVRDEAGTDVVLAYARAR